MSMTKGIPGLARFDHVGLTVPDLDKAVDFYCNVIGGTELYRLGPFDARQIPKMPDGRDWMEAHVNVPDGAVNIAMVQLVGGMLLELFQYDRPEDARRTPPRNCDYGGHHIAFKVKDLEAAKAYLRSRDVRVLEGPISLDQGPAAGLKANYLMDPWGNYLELVQYDAPPFTSLPGFIRLP